MAKLKIDDGFFGFFPLFFHSLDMWAFKVVDFIHVKIKEICDYKILIAAGEKGRWIIQNKTICNFTKFQFWEQKWLI